MALALTVTPDPSGAYVTLRASGGTPPYTVRAFPAGDYPDYTVRTSWVRPSGAGADVRVGIDGQMPLGVDTAYQLLDATGAVLNAGPYQVASSSPILSDALDPTRYQHVTVQAQPPGEWEAGSVWWAVLGATDPYVSIAPMKRRHGTMALRLDTRAERAGLMATLLQPGRPLLLRANCTDAVDDLLFVVTGARDELVNPAKPGGARLMFLDYQVVSPELGPVQAVPGRIYADLPGEALTYADLLTRFGTYADLLTGTPTYTLGPELVANGNFAAGGTSWGYFWTQLAWTFAGTALSAAAPTGGAAAVIGPAPVYAMATTPGQRYRVAGRVRCTDGAAAPYVHTLTNTLPGVADYFQPGLAQQVQPLPSSPAWTPFAVVVTVPAGDDTLTIYFRADLASAGAVVEWDDLSIKAIT